MQLRRKVINKVKPKVIAGKKLSGTMMATLAQSYVTAINNGAVPNIESAWNYICKNECNKAIDESFNKFEESIKEQVFNRIPMEEDELKECFVEAKRDALSLFTKKAVGQVQEEYIRELKLKMKQLFYQIKDENEREGNNSCNAFLEESYNIIQRKLKTNDFQGGWFEYE